MTAHAEQISFTRSSIKALLHGETELLQARRVNGQLVGGYRLISSEPAVGGKYLTFERIEDGQHFIGLATDARQVNMFAAQPAGEPSL